MTHQGSGGYGGGPPGYGSPGVPAGGATPPPGQWQGHAQAPAPPGPPKKPNVALWLGIGCAALLVMTAVVGGVIFYLLRQTGQRIEAGFEIAIDAGLRFDAGTGKGGPICEAAAACCERAAKVAGANPAAIAACLAFRTHTTELACQQALEAYKRSAPVTGATCP